MSADAFPVYNAYCADCNEGTGPHDDEDDAADWASEHDAEYHPNDARTDDDYDRYKEAKDES